jgi:hypothetical protein
MGYQSFLSINSMRETKYFGKLGVMMFNATFNNISDMREGLFYYCRKPEYPEKITNLSRFIT